MNQSSFRACACWKRKNVQRFIRALLTDLSKTADTIDVRTSLNKCLILKTQSENLVYVFGSWRDLAASVPKNQYLNAFKFIGDSIRFQSVQSI